MSQTDMVAEPTAPSVSTAQALLIGLLSFAVMIVDGYDIGAMPILVPHLAGLWAAEPASFGPALSAVVIGLGLGAFFLAPLGDRFGRRTTTIVALAVISLATLGTASSASATGLFWWRLLTGTALGACLPNVLAILAEVIPARRRASAMSIVSCGIPIGAMLPGMIGPMLVEAQGWQAVFVTPGLLMLALTLVVALCLRGLPVSPGAPAPRGKRRWHWTDIPVLAPLGRGYLVRTIIFSGLFCFNALSMYMLASWLPTVLQQAGFSFRSASLLTSALQVGGLFGGLILAVLIDRRLTIKGLLGGYALVALGLVALALVAPGFATWGIVLLLIGLGVGGAHIALPAVAANLYPATMLSAGIGLAVTVARLGAMGGPMIGAWLIGAHVSTGTFFLAVLLPVAGCVLCVLAFARARLADGPSD
jgi:AAHS family 4-hydroxybenzoate transporter-like MFS transporter